MPATLPLKIFSYDRQKRGMSVYGGMWQIIIENIGYWWYDNSVAEMPWKSYPWRGGSLPNLTDRSLYGDGIKRKGGAWLWQLMRFCLLSSAYWLCWLPLAAWLLRFLPFLTESTRRNKNAYPVCQQDRRCLYRHLNNQSREHPLWSGCFPHL